MQRRQRLFLPVLLPLAALTAAAATPVRGDAAEDRVKQIRSRYDEIESAELSNLKVEFGGDSDPISARCTTYLEGGEVVKVHLSWGGDHFASDEYFYYSAGRLIFIYASDGSWRFTGETSANGEGETIDEVVEHRVYLSEGAVIRHLEKSARSKKPESIPALLAKAGNQPSDDSDRAASLVAHGQAAFLVKTGSDLGKLLRVEP